MLDTLYAIGKEISQDRDVWEDIISVPDPKNKESKFEFLNLKIVFDLDQQSVVISPNHLEVFSKNIKKLKSVGNLNIQGGNNKSIYVACAAEKIEQLSKTLFGKKGESAGKGEFMEAIDKEAPYLHKSTLYDVLSAIYRLRYQFALTCWDAQKEKYDLKLLQENLNLGAFDRLVLIYASVTSQKHALTEVALAEIDGYVSFIENKYFKSSNDQLNPQQKLCYATGTQREDVKAAEFSERYNINKFFVKTTQNFANNFDKDSFAKNYQLSEEAEIYLDRGSEYILNNLVTSIAEVRHAIIPRLFRQDNADISIRLGKLTNQTDLLFKFTDLQKFDDYFYYASDREIYWLNFLAIDSDGNYFKISNQILDVPNFFCIDLINAFKAASTLFQPWLGNTNQVINFASIFFSIPIRKNERNNPALKLFAQILERRQVDRVLLFKHFKDLALCHWFKRYKGYSNITEPKIDNFDFTIKDGVFKYLGFLYALQQLNLIQNPITMKEENETVSANSIAENIQAFFSTLNYSNEQQALFYLGRALNQIAYAQEKKGHNKRILEKLNFNGMDSKHITRLSTELFEKAMQHDVLSDAQWNLAEFNRRFNPEHWKLNPQEATFYILSGYTYGIKSKN
jgi:CRISPR-associated protein Csh1